MIRRRNLCSRNLYKLITHSSSSSSSGSSLHLLAFRSSIPNSYTHSLNDPSKGFRFFGSGKGFDSVCPDFFELKRSNFVRNRDVIIKDPKFVRAYCSGKNNDEPSGEWTEDIEYLDESGRVMFTDKGIRSVEPGLDDHVMVGVLKKPLLNASAVAKIVEVVNRWKWGPDLETQLDKLQFVPNMTHLHQALKVIKESDGSLSLFRWAKNQSWYLPKDECYALLFYRLNENKDYDGIESLFDEMVRDSGNSENGISSFKAFNQVIQYLAKAEKLDVSFCCFKKVRDSGCKVDTQTYNALITLFLNKGLPYKAFEIYENMEAAGCSLDGSTYELLIPNLAKSGRLDAAYKLFQEMKERKLKPNVAIFSSLVDSMGKAGRLDTSRKVYMEMQGYGLRPSATMYASLVESFVKAGKLDAARQLWDEMKKRASGPTLVSTH